VLSLFSLKKLRWKRKSDIARPDPIGLYSFWKFIAIIYKGMKLKSCGGKLEKVKEEKNK